MNSLSPLGSASLKVFTHIISFDPPGQPLRWRRKRQRIIYRQKPQRLLTTFSLSRVLPTVRSANTGEVKLPQSLSAAERWDCDISVQSLHLFHSLLAFLNLLLSIAHQQK